MSQNPAHKPVRLLVAKDGSIADLLVPADADSQEVTFEWCMQMLHEASVVVNAAVTERLREVLAQFTGEEEVRDWVAKGTPVEHGTDGYIDWAEGLEPAERCVRAGDESTGEPEAIDFYSCSAFTMVKVGQRLGRIVPPTDGVDGTDVRGQNVSARAGKPVKVKLDESIALDSDGVMTAQIDGVLSRSREKLAVRQYLEIPGYVDFSTGNVEFEGDVKVLKGVRDLFEVKATGNIEIGQLIESATVDAGGDVFATGGMAGRERGICKAGGDLAIRYLDSTSVAVGGSLRFEREMINCETMVKGSIESPGGSIIGGETQVVGKVVVGTLGSNSQVPTTLHIGSVPVLESKLESLERLIEAMEVKEEKCRKELAKLKGPGRVLSTDDRERQTELSFEMHSIESQRAKCRDSHRQLTERIRAVRTVDVSVEKTLYAGVRLVCGTQIFRINKDIKGPVRILLDRRGELVYRVGAHGQNMPLRQISEIRAVAA
ncbi:MAG: DUF342 domain-containing protein [Phycisphaerales bacterium JB050]